MPKTNLEGRLIDMLNFTLPTCIVCGSSNIDIDALCSAKCRQERYDEKKCGICGKKIPHNTTGWYVPDFGWYLDIWYYCPKCIAKHNADYEQLQQVIEQAEKKLPELEARYNSMPADVCMVYEWDGEYTWDGYDAPNFREFQEQVAYYKKHKAEIIQLRKAREKLDDEIQELREILQQKGRGKLLKANR